jgi:hypothetical protein
LLVAIPESILIARPGGFSSDGEAAFYFGAQGRPPARLAVGPSA